jgi:hypothetical protein
MEAVTQFASREVKINNEIEGQVAQIVSASPLTLPASDSEIARLYVRKIQGTYNVDRAKKDTDNAIDLLYIAYNTTPQAEGAIRVKIGDIMSSLIDAQGASELVMKKAIGVSNGVISAISNTFPDWLDVRTVKGVDDVPGVKDLKTFLGKDVLELAHEIKTKALDIKGQLDNIAVTYDNIIKETEAATKSSETALAARLSDRAAMQKELNESNAKREQLELLVTEMGREVKKYEQMARDFESRASTAEERAFVMSIVQVASQMLSAALPPIVTAVTAGATGGTSLIASAAANTVNRAVGDKNAEATSNADTERQKIDIKRQLAQKTADAAESEKQVANIKSDLESLDKELKLEKEKEGSAPAALAEGSAVVKAIQARIDKKQVELKTAENKYSELAGGLAGLQASLIALDKGLGRMSEQQESAAAGLREMQMKMLDKVELYEKERSTQNAELIKVSALLKGKQDEQETIQLTIRSLNLSISALKQAQEIIREISFFFQSFADFMDRVCKETQVDIDKFEGVAGRENLRENYFKSLLEGTDKFFVRQQAEWHAISFVMDRFCQSFADGRSKLNKLNGTYITGPQLESYFKTASAKLEEIARERKTASDQRIIDLDGYRKELKPKTV